jgi:RNA polymerase sigma-70 factor (ECF subfamily)
VTKSDLYESGVEAAVADESLTAAAISGDKAALTELLCRYDTQLRQRLEGRISRQYRAAFDEDDVFQVTYLEAFLRIGSFRSAGKGAFLAWLVAIAENNIRDAIKALERVRRPPPSRQVSNVVGDDSYVCLFATLADSQSTPSQGASREEVKGMLDRALAQLPPDYARVVRLCDLNGRSAQEAATEMNRSPGCVHMLKARAHDRLAVLLGASTKFLPVSRVNPHVICRLMAMHGGFWKQRIEREN